MAPLSVLGKSAPRNLMKLEIPEKLEQGRIRDGEMGSTSAYGTTGAFFVMGPCNTELLMIGSDGEGWEHVSVSCRKRTPNWAEMCFVKDLFWEDYETVIQFHPAKSEYVNCHSYCLHLWRPSEKHVPTPPSILVGPKC
jgi:hypothetical protein